MSGGYGGTLKADRMVRSGPMSGPPICAPHMTPSHRERERERPPQRSPKDVVPAIPLLS